VCVCVCVCACVRERWWWWRVGVGVGWLGVLVALWVRGRASQLSWPAAPTLCARLAQHHPRLPQHSSSSSSADRQLPQPLCVVQRPGGRQPRRRSRRRCQTFKAFAPHTPPHTPTTKPQKAKKSATALPTLMPVPWRAISAGGCVCFACNLDLFLTAALTPVGNNPSQQQTSLCLPQGGEPLSLAVADPRGGPSN